MHQFIPANIIKEILDQVNIVNIIHERLKIKKIGKNYYALCPFHTENTPSFTINVEKQYFYCFGCNANGNSVDFLMQYDHMSFIESIHALSHIAGVNIDANYIDRKKIVYYKKQTMYQTTKIVENLYFQNIQYKHAQIAQYYLKNRNITLKSIKTFNLGFSHNQFFLSKNIHDQKTISNLVYLGIMINTRHKYQYDRFYNKIIFPIKNQQGNITGFGGRDLNNNYPKYINSPQSEIFNKSYQIYGIDKINIQKKKEYILIVEGYFDVISLTQYNIENVVAILGTNITTYQINILLKLSHNIIFCYDGDEAGRNASWKTMKIMLLYINNIRNIQFILLPRNEDPNSIIYKEGTKKFKYRIRHAIHIVNYLLKKIIEKVNFNCINTITLMLDTAIPLIHSIPNEYIRIYLKKKIGEKIGIFDTLQLKKIFYQKKPYIQKEVFKINNIHILISLIIQNPQLKNIVPFTVSELQNINIAGLPIFLEILYFCKQYDNISTAQIVELYRTKKTFYIVKKLACLNNPIDYNNINHIFIDLIRKIYCIALKKKYKILIIKDRSTNLNNNEKHILWKINQILSYY